MKNTGSGGRNGNRLSASCHVVAAHVRIRDFAKVCSFRTGLGTCSQSAAIFRPKRRNSRNLRPTLVNPEQSSQPTGVRRAAFERPDERREGMMHKLCPTFVVAPISLELCHRHRQTFGLARLFETSRKVIAALFRAVRLPLRSMEDAMPCCSKKKFSKKY